MSIIRTLLLSFVLIASNGVLASPVSTGSAEIGQLIDWNSESVLDSQVPMVKGSMEEITEDIYQVDPSKGWVDPRVFGGRLLDVSKSLFIRRLVNSF